jgi:flavin reductase (DIM6/NTAB) family NADH-FMN oxidoreductase RutF
MEYREIGTTGIKIAEIGAFLTVQSGGKINTMTIGWATFGIIWRKQILMVAVRPTRHTFTLIDKADNFTVSVPSSDMSKELGFCGTRSGRECDKFEKCGLRVEKARTVGSPVIKCPGLHFECRIVFKAAMDSANLVDDYEYLYPNRDYHTLYFGEIVDWYEIE